ncbi:hypothetical protein WICPIJ_000558 [Wickerhamomyces pijperi]|uniref:Sphingoid long-chain base transporter RSB1 n=1 Tax=Wickerhamomyces pijperi TaxID=599730 RepID=A0A9P8QGJ4_WICPI|nr:hypothetical protein WICPIJ_000558 [Wickerhamomyces pijperi]
MTSTITNLLPQITSLENKISTINDILATATASVDVISYSQMEEKLAYSLSILVNQEFIATATATATSELAAATSNISAAESALSSIIEANNLYGMHPSYGGNMAVAIVMGLFLAIHSGLGIWYRTWWFGISYFCGCGLELAGYIGRILSAHDVDNVDYFLDQIVTLTIAPCFIMAGIYFLLGQLIIVYGPQYALLKPMHYSYIFISCDVISLAIQAAGGAIAAVNVVDYESPDSGTHIMVAGLAFQVFSMSVFIFFFAHFLYKIQYFHPDKYEQFENGEAFDPEHKSFRQARFFKHFIFVICLGVIFVFVRCIYRVVELAEGWSGYLITHEAYFMILDALMMALTCLCFSVFHPGFFFGKNGVQLVKSKKRTEVNHKEYQNSEYDVELQHNNLEEINQRTEKEAY